jgi:tRNA G18 (ribose-2'-O)-methylase SpoU
MKRLPPQEHRKRGPTPAEISQITRNALILIADNVMDTFNIGALFRLAEAVAAEKIYLCDQTPTPPNPRIHKAAVGTERWVPWAHHVDTMELLKELKSQHHSVKIIAVEQDSRSISYADLAVGLPSAIIVGHETRGLSPEILARADVIVEIPMYGVTRSLNVAASAAVVVYKLLEAETDHTHRGRELL